MSLQQAQYAVQKKAPSLFKVAGVMFLVDLFWLATGGIFFREMVRNIQCGEAIDFRFLPGMLVYLFLAYMLMETRSYKQAFLYGVCIYGVFDFTNLAIFSKYDWKLALADTLWGGVLFAFARYLMPAF
jgi:uncharacterized membrane protein